MYVDFFEEVHHNFEWSRCSKSTTACKNNLEHVEEVDEMLRKGAICCFVPFVFGVDFTAKEVESSHHTLVTMLV